MEPSYHAGETSITPHHCESHCGFFDKSVPAIRSIIKTKPHSLDCGSVDPIIAESSFAGAVLFKKAGDGSQKIRGCWDSIHVFEVALKADQWQYKLTTTIMLWLQTRRRDSGILNLGGSLTRQFEHQVPTNQSAHSITHHQSGPANNGGEREINIKW